MKFCKKCHKRVVTKIESHVVFTMDTVKMCMCGNRALLFHGSVIKRLVSEWGVHDVKKIIT